ncbi:MULTISPECIES: DUF1514 family protein [Bacillati]|nr:DUF1514 family protein [Staphylococcus warneri]MCE5011313.1 DUF1514 family protein [Staphylococcus warneri]MCM3051229.1 DUF1514 family protein [Staphylococcus warneri]MDC6376663.1 DUF1514 family protein [Staphylococcus warneri]MDH8806835.1 DUF1514 family protein [Staphylococcus warneri]MDH8809160.1 DUF1514 family protein [Staphylococcus warneri]
MWFIISILLTIALLISMGLQYEQRKKIEAMTDYIEEYIYRNRWR